MTRYKYEGLIEFDLEKQGDDQNCSVSFKILSQSPEITYRDGSRGSGFSWRLPDGSYIRSAMYPDLGASEIYIRGTSIPRDDMLVIRTPMSSEAAEVLLKRIIHSFDKFAQLPAIQEIVNAWKSKQRSQIQLVLL